MSNLNVNLNLKREFPDDRRRLINKHLDSITDAKFMEMRSLLENYHQELEKGIKENLKIENENFKKHFFNCLENLLNQLALLRNEKKQEKINEIFQWFNKRIQFFKDMNSITSRTSKNPYEKYPDIDTGKKTDYYEAGNFPLFFESKNRTEDDGLLPPKDRLKEFKRKTLLSSQSSKKNIPLSTITNNFPNNYFNNPKDSVKTNLKSKDVDLDYNNNNPRISSATSSNCFRSTHYTANNTATKFFSSQNFSVNSEQNLNTNLNFNPAREIKSSYSTFRPRYDYSNLVIEKNNINFKQKELSEKRNQEEMKEFTNEWGISRARYIEEVEKKNEIKQLLKHYEENNEMNPENLNLNNSEQKFNSRKSQENLLGNDKSISKQNQSDDYFNFLQYDKNSNSQKNLLKQNTIQKSPNILTQFKDSPDKFSMYKASPEKMLLKSGSIGNITEFSLMCEDNTDKFIRHTTNKIKNLDKKTNLINCNKEEIKHYIKFNEDSSYKKSENITKQMKQTLEKIPTDKVIIMKAHDSVYSTRHTFGILLNVKEIDNSKDGYKYHNNPLSLYDDMNLNLDNKINIKEKIIENKRPGTGYEFLRSHYNRNVNKEDLLNQRKNLAEYNSVNDFKKQEKPRNCSLNYERVRSAFIPPTDERRYPKFFLPEPGCGLLSRPFDPNEKKKGKGKGLKKGKGKSKG